MDGRTRSWLAALAAAWMLCGPVHAGEPAAATRADEPVMSLVRPSLGRPVFVAPSGGFEVVAHIRPVTGPPTFRLVSSRAPTFQYKLSAPAEAGDLLEAGQPIRLTLPAGLPLQTYDLEVCAGVTRLVARHCVAVWQPSEQVRLVHLGHFNVGDLTAPRFDPELIDAVNAWGPTLIVASGNYLDVTHPDLDAGWHALVNYVSKFDAPWVMVAGEHDDLTAYGAYVASSPIGVVDVGRLRGVVLYDHLTQPLNGDNSQIAWIERMLIAPRSDHIAFAVSSDPRPRLLEHWQFGGALAETIKAARLGLYLGGGHVDADNRALAGRLDDVGTLKYLSTHQASRATVGGATGISRFRVIDMDGGHVRLPGRATAGQTTASLTADDVQIALTPAQSGSAAHVTVDATNRLPVAAEGLRCRAVLRNPSQRTPWCLGARLTQVLQVDELTVCWVEFDLPARGVLRAQVGVDDPPTPPAVSVTWQMPKVLDDGATGTIELVNRGDQPVRVRPLLRAGGDPAPYGLLEPAAPAGTAYTLNLQPGRPVRLTVAGAHLPSSTTREALHLYLTGGPVWWPIVCEPDGAAAAPRSAQR